MIRDLGQLTARTFDVLVIGGGVYGLTIAYDAAQRGLQVALVERDDFGSGASFNHLRTIHGGLRYLQSLDVGRARESIQERRTIARIAPHTIRPLPFVLPLSRSITRGKLAMRAGFLLDRVLASDRNQGVSATHRLPAGRVYSRGSAIQRFPGLKRQGLTGAAVWFDYVTTEPDRLTFAWAQAAVNHRATLANHAEADSLIKDGARIVGARIRDTVAGGTIEVGARLVVNATGAGVDRVLKSAGLASHQPMAMAMNLVTRRDAGEEALGGRSASGRNLFMVPWRERAVFGTWEAPRLAEPGDAVPSERDVVSFVADLNHAFPSLDLSLADVTLVHRGVVPASLRDGHVVLQGHEQIRDHAGDGVDGIVTVAGTKYTTARAVAERVVDLVAKKLGAQTEPCRTAVTVLPGGSVRDVGLAIAEARREHDEGLPTDTIPHLIGAYGSQFRDVLDVASTAAGLKDRVAPDSPVIGAELVVAARSEMAVTLADAVVRRTPVGALGYPGDEALSRAADLVGGVLGWSDDRKRAEISGVKNYYSPATVP
ncbi:MAG TPA: glycerol-3-phosphate dehydrogenase/oxidase [Vicinamibacterales bacterium]|jgi:glycerol-3-phosphate dehydrogenase